MWTPNMFVEVWNRYYCFPPELKVSIKGPLNLIVAPGVKIAGSSVGGGHKEVGDIVFLLLITFTLKSLGDASSPRL